MERRSGRGVLAPQEAGSQTDLAASAGRSRWREVVPAGRGILEVRIVFRRGIGLRIYVVYRRVEFRILVERIFFERIFFERIFFERIFFEFRFVYFFGLAIRLSGCLPHLAPHGCADPVADPLPP